MTKKMMRVCLIAYITFACAVCARAEGPSAVTVREVNPQDIAAMKQTQPARPAAKEATGQPASVQVRELSSADSFTETMKENQRLKDEIAQLKDKLDKGQTRINVYMDRLNAFGESNLKLKKEAKEAQDAAALEQETLKKEIGNLEVKAQKLNKQIGALKDERQKNEHYAMWQKADIELKDTQAVLKKMSDDYQVGFKKMADEYEALKMRNGKLHYNMGNLLFKAGDYKAAAAEYESAREFLPNDPDILYNLAVLYDHYLQDSEKSAQYYSLYLKSQPGAANAALAKERLADSSFRARVLK